MLSGCATLGPAAVKAGRTDYNIALQSSIKEELLLNIVRLRHSDKPYFLEVSSISATSEASANIGGSREKGALGGVTYLERPNIIYSPLGGEKFARQLLTPVDLPTITLLRGAGWDFDDILRVFVDRINGVQNAPTGSSATPEGTPSYREFLALVEAIDELEDLGMLSVSWVRAGESEQAVMLISEEGRGTHYFRDIVSSLDIDPHAEFYRLTTGIPLGESGGEHIYINTRTILSAMFFLGQSIQFPTSVLESGVVNSNLGPDGRRFDWSPIFSDLITIKTSPGKPVSAHVMAAYDGLWYYLDNTDIDGKETLTMLSVLINLKSGTGAQGAPILTLPVGG